MYDKDEQLLQDLWDAMPATTLDECTADEMPQRVLAALDHHDRSLLWRRKWKVGGSIVAAAALVLLLTRLGDPSNEADTSPAETQSASSQSAPPLQAGASSSSDTSVEPNEATPQSPSSTPTLPHEESRFAQRKVLGSTHSLLTLHRALSLAIESKDVGQASLLVKDLLAVDVDALPSSAEQTWRAALATVTEQMPALESELALNSSWSSGFSAALKRMSPEALTQFSISDLDLNSIGAESIAQVGDELVRRRMVDELFALAMQNNSFEAPALRALHSQKGRELLSRTLARPQSRGSQFLLHAVAELAPSSGLEYAQRFVQRSKTRRDALLAIAAFPAVEAFPVLLAHEKRYGSEALHEALLTLLARGLHDVSNLDLPAGVRRQEEAVDALLSHGSREASHVLLTWALRSPNPKGTLQPAERERLILALVEGRHPGQVELLREALPALRAESDSLAAAAVLSLSRLESFEFVIDAVFDKASSSTPAARDLIAILTNPRRSGESTVLLRLRRFLRTLPTPPPPQANDKTVDSIHLPFGHAS